MSDEFTKFMTTSGLTAAQIAADLAEYVEENQGNHRMARAAASSLWDAVEALESTDL